MEIWLADMRNTTDHQTDRLIWKQITSFKVVLKTRTCKATKVEVQVAHLLKLAAKHKSVRENFSAVCLINNYIFPFWLRMNRYQWSTCWVLVPGCQVGLQVGQTGCKINHCKILWNYNLTILPHFQWNMYLLSPCPRLSRRPPRRSNWSPSPCPSCPNLFFDRITVWWHVDING